MAVRPDRLVAHTPPEGSDKWHYLDEHLRDVATLASEFAAPFGGQGLAWWAGIYHDLGKAHPSFQDYLWKNYLEPNKKHPTVDHKTAGAVVGYDLFRLEPLAHMILGHHGGMSDLADVQLRLKAFPQTDTERLNTSRSRFDTLDLTSNAPAPIPPSWITGDLLEVDVLQRMLFSALVDADALDTEAHMNRVNAGVRNESWPTVGELHERFMTDQRALETRIAASAVADSKVNGVRREVYEACIERAFWSPGFFRLTVPTGGGKTRSSLGFALEHSMHWKKRRIIVAVPYLTITEQTAKVYRDALGEDALIEHHSGINPPDRHEHPDDRETAAERRRQLVAQNWDAPLIVTTTVQLFESLFTNRTSRARKLHNIANSVIILDEIQTVPAQFRAAIFDMLREMVAHYGVSVVLSTATQPVLDTIVDQLGDADEVRELAPHPEELFAELRRVEYCLPCLSEKWDWPRLAGELRDAEQAMAIVNTVADAATLFSELDDSEAFHLSTRTCGQHRRDTLDLIRRRLTTGEPCMVVSTQLVEAGVDLDFPTVFRALGPLDSIVQAAGRCNREGKLAKPGRVVVFEPLDGGMPPGIYRQGAQEGLIMLRDVSTDLHHPEVFTTYFQRLYGLADADPKDVQGKRRHRNFDAVDEVFEIIDDDTFPVFVDYRGIEGGPDHGDRWERVQANLEAHQRAGLGVKGLLRRLMREAQPWLVAVRLRRKDELLDKGIIQPMIDDIVWRWTGVYDRKLGIQDHRIDVNWTVI